MNRQSFFLLRAFVLGTGLGVSVVSYRAGFQEFSLATLLLMTVLYLWLVKREQQKSDYTK